MLLQVTVATVGHVPHRRPVKEAARGDRNLPLSLTPAEVIGVQDRKGSLTAGKDADIVILNRDDLTVETVVIGGKQVTAA